MAADRKWRPSLGLVVGGTIVGVLAMPAVGIWAYRWLGSILQYQMEAQFAWDIAKLVVGAIIAISAAVLGYLLWRLLVRPIRSVATRADRIRRGGDPETIGHYGTQELAELGDSVLGMGKALRNREATLRAYADHVTHELKSPLTTLRGAAELLEDDLPEDQRRALVRQVGEAGARMQTLLDGLRDLAIAQEVRFEGRSQVSHVMMGLTPQIPVSVVQDGVLPMASEGVTMLLEHLVGNAAAHGATEATVEVTGNALIVNDNGPGISEGNRTRIFEPFFTTRRGKGGTGMGLAILRRMLEANGGTIALEDSEQGARFRVAF